MKLARRRFLHLAAGAAALPTASRLRPGASATRSAARRRPLPDGEIDGAQVFTLPFPASSRNSRLDAHCVNDEAVIPARSRLASGVLVIRLAGLLLLLNATQILDNRQYSVGDDVF